LKPICATYRELEDKKLRLSNTPSGIFKTKGLPYAFHIHHPFDTNNYPRLKITFPSYRLNCINGFVCPYNSWTDHYKWHRSRGQNQDCLRYIYWTLMRQWLHFGHKGNYFSQYKFHQVPKTIQDEKDRIKQQQEDERKRKAQKAGLFGLPKWKKNKTPKQLTAQQDSSK
jgi:hypothetical protein